MRKTTTADRRVVRTRTLLREALAALVREKAYEKITVTDILERANVGRSTFYMHYRDKDELLSTGIDELLEAARSVAPTATGADRILRFSLPILEHIDRHRRAGLGAVGAKGWAVIHARLRRALAQLVSRDLRSRALPAPLLADWIASTFVLTLHWWVEHGARLSAREANDVFRSLTLPVLARESGISQS